MPSVNLGLKVLLKYRWRRFVNGLHRMAAFGKANKSGVRSGSMRSGSLRSGTARKGGLHGFFLVLMVIGYPLMAFNYSYQVMDKLLPGLRFHVVDEHRKPIEHQIEKCTEEYDFTYHAKTKGQKDHHVIKFSCAKKPTALNQSIPEPVQRAVGLQLALLVLATIVSGIATREITAPEWDLEWLITLPVPLTALIDARILQRSVLSPLAIILIWPFCTMFLWHITLNYWSIPLGIVMALPLLVMAGCVQTLFDTGLRLVTKPSNTRNIQAMVAALFPLALIAAMSPMFADLTLLPDAADLLPSWTKWAPFELLIAVLTSTELSSGVMRAALLAAELLIIYRVCSLLLERLLSRGVVAGSGWLTGAERPSHRPPAERAAAQPSRWQRIGPMARKELALLWRDKNYLIQAFLVPLIAFGAQLWLTGAGERLMAGPLKYGAVAAFGYVGYMLTLTAFQVMTAEKQALWLLHTIPSSLSASVSAKLKLWGLVGLIFCGVLLAIRFSTAPVSESLATTIGLSAFALAGVAIYTLIGGSIGIIGADMLADDQRKRLSFTATFVFMNLTGFYVYGMLAGNVHTASVVFILAVLLAAALWQKAEARLPYLLDPTSEPPRTVTIADGMLATFSFFVIQTIVVAIIAYTSDADAIPASELAAFGVKAIFLGFLIGGAIVCGAFLWRFRQKKAQYQPPLLGAGGLGQALAVALPLAAIACATGIGYLELKELYGWFSEGQATGQPTYTWWAIAIMVLAAPLFEEYIFRGMVFASLVRSLEGPRGLLWAILASSLLFALMHPLASVAPVLVVGLTTAYAYHLTGALAAPIVIHGLYNATVVGYALLNS